MTPHVVVLHNGSAPPPRAALVLLSGMDSVAAAHWAAERYAPVVALGFDYSQPGAELAAAQAIAERRGWTWVREIVPGIGHRSPEAGRDASGVSRANVPGRNGILIWHAANVAARLFPGGRCALVVGCNLDDAAGFPDCRAEFLYDLERTIAAGLAGVVDLRLDAPWAPWLTPADARNKEDILYWAAQRPEALEDVRYSVSCYRGTRCGICDPCRLRAAAFNAAGLEDGTEPPPAVNGGDPAREPRTA
jgi:7-cyano-7-deazaguanine synthase